MNLEWTYPTVMELPASDARLRPDFADLEAARRHILPALDLVVAGATLSIFNVWWIPGKSFEVIYEVTGGDNRREIVTVKFSAPGEVEAVFDAARAVIRSEDAVKMLPGWSAVLIRFPADERLSALPRVLDLPAVSRLIGSDGDQSSAIESWSLLSYLPRDRASICYTLRDGEGKRAGKLHGAAAATHHAMQKLWSAPQRTFRMPEPMALDSDLSMRWERFVPGSRFDIAGDRALIDRQLQRTLSDLASLHAMPLDGLPVNGRAEVCHRILRKVMRRIERALPNEAERAARLVRALAQRAGELPQEPHVTMHGDFHTGNVLFDGAVPGFIDLDNLAYGEAAFDLALFASRLLLTEIVTGRTLDGLGRLIEDLPLRYREAGGAKVSEDVFAWYMAALLVGRQLKTCIRHVSPNLSRTAEQLIGAAEVIFDVGRVRASDLAHMRAAS